jgi:hypothetical protein
MKLDDTFNELRADLIHEDGPRISTMRNYRFCIVVYEPKHEYEVRHRVGRLSGELQDVGWMVKEISLQALLLARLRSHGPEYLERLAAREKAVQKRAPERALSLLTERLAPDLEGPDGLAADVVREIETFVDQDPDNVDRTLILLGHAGSLYPFFSASALLKHIDGRTRNAPVVLLYPGVRHPDNGLSFMGKVPPHTDYRPRIYG